MKTLTAASVATCVFLLLILIVATWNTVDTYRTYGPSYVETIIINGVQTQTTITIWNNVVSLLMLLWLLFLTMLLTARLAAKTLREEHPIS